MVKYNSEKTSHSSLNIDLVKIYLTLDRAFWGRSGSISQVQPSCSSWCQNYVESAWELFVVLTKCQINIKKCSYTAAASGLQQSSLVVTPEQHLSWKGTNGLIWYTTSLMLPHTSNWLGVNQHLSTVICLSFSLFLNFARMLPLQVKLIHWNHIHC